jgi:ornithine cyclodeaminase/alanine dehydrogenase-like protein (mu-crystallin family)
LCDHPGSGCILALRVFALIHIAFEEVHQLLSVGNLVEPLRRAFTASVHSPGRVQYDLMVPDKTRTLLLMPAWRPYGGIGVKIVTVFPDNAARKLPSVNAAYLLLSGETGQPHAWIDGRALTLFRTAAVSALAADVLAPATPRAFLMVGTGALSRYLVEGHLSVRKYDSVAIWGRDPSKAAGVARELSARGWPVGVAHDLEDAVRSADVISCATLAEQPLIRGTWLKATSHLDLVGSFKPAMREADDACMRGAFIAVDTFGALCESGDLIEPLARGVIAKENIFLLGEILAARRRTAHPGKTVFKSVGVSHADLAAAEYLCERRLVGLD